MAGLAKWKVTAGAACCAVAVLLIGNAALGEDPPATKEVASLTQDRGAGTTRDELKPVGRLLAFAPDGKLLWCGNEDGVVFSYEVPTLKPKSKLNFGSRLSWFALTTDGKTIVAADKSTLIVRDTAGEDEPKIIQLPNVDMGVDTASIASDNKTVAVGVGLDILIWDIVANKQVAKLGPTLQSSRIRALAISPDGKSVVSGAVGDNGQLWDVATAKAKVTLPGRNSLDPLMGSATWSADGKLFATAEDLKYQPTDVFIWFGGSGAAKGVLTGHKAAVTSLAFFPDGKTIATGSLDTTVNLWDVKECAVKGTIQCTGRVSIVAVSPDGKLIAVAREAGPNDSKTGALGPGGKSNLFLYSVSDVVK